MKDQTSGKHEASGRPFQWPWSRKGWYTDEYRTSRDQELDAKVEDSGKGLNPYGYYTDRPGLAISPLMHNPYFGFLFVPLGGWLIWFLLGKGAADSWWTLALICLVGLVGLLAAVMSALRIPGWHRARKLARAHVAEHGGDLPPELRWYT